VSGNPFALNIRPVRQTKQYPAAYSPRGGLKLSRYAFPDIIRRSRSCRVGPKNVTGYVVRDVPGSITRLSIFVVFVKIVDDRRAFFREKSLTRLALPERNTVWTIWKCGRAEPPRAPDFGPTNRRTRTCTDQTCFERPWKPSVSLIAFV